MNVFFAFKILMNFFFLFYALVGGIIWLFFIVMLVNFSAKNEVHAIFICSVSFLVDVELVVEWMLTWSFSQANKDHPHVRQVETKVKTSRNTVKCSGRFHCFSGFLLALLACWWEDSFVKVVVRVFTCSFKVFQRNFWINALIWQNILRKHCALTQKVSS